MRSRFRDITRVSIGVLFSLFLISTNLRIVCGQSGRSIKRTSPTVSAPNIETAQTPEGKHPEESKLSVLVADFIFSPTVTVETGWAYRSFVARLAESQRVSVNAVNEMRRKDASEQAKQRKERFVVWLRLDIDPGPRDLEKDPETASISTLNPACLFVTYEVFAPVTGKAIGMGHVNQQGQPPSRCMGGAYHPSPFPDERQVRRQPPEDTLKEAGREAADRVMTLLHLPVPPKHP